MTSRKQKRIFVAKPVRGKIDYKALRRAIMGRFPKTLAYLAALAFLIIAPGTAGAFTCDQVHWAVQNMDPATLAAHTAAATPEERAQGRACLKQPKAKPNARWHRHAK